MEDDINRSKKRFFDQLYAIDDESDHEPRDERLMRSMNALRKPEESNASSIKPSPVEARRVTRTVSAPISAAVLPMTTAPKLQPRRTVTDDTALVSLMAPTSSATKDDVSTVDSRSVPPVNTGQAPKKLFEGLHFCKPSSSHEKPRLISL